MDTMRAMIMAGGRGERMRASGVPVPKPLVEVAGVTLLELNVRALVAQGFRDIVVVAPAALPEIGEALTGTIQQRYPMADIELFTEDSPLGNIGAAGTQADRGEPLLVVYSDNLSSISLRRLCEQHARTRADLTLAAHVHPFTMPYGEMVLDGDRVTGYREKPTIPVTVSSAYSVLGVAALRALPLDRPTGLVDLTRTMLEKGCDVRAFNHQSDWVDVNDAGSFDRAAEVLADHPDLFGAPSS